MSFAKYLTRKAINIDLSLESYKTKLENEIHRNLFNDEKRIPFILDNFSDFYNLKNNLEQIDYPYRIKLMNSLSLRNNDKIDLEHYRFSEWSKNDYTEIKKNIESSLVELRGLMSGVPIDYLECKNNFLLNNIYESALSESEKVVSFLKNCFIEYGVNESKVIFEGLFSDELHLKEGSVIFGDRHCFDITTEFELKNLELMNEGLVQCINKNKLNKNYSYKYINTTEQGSVCLENIKRGLALGMKASIPEEFIMKNKFENFGKVWKAKFENNNLIWLDYEKQ